MTTEERLRYERNTFKAEMSKAMQEIERLKTELAMMEMDRENWRLAYSHAVTGRGGLANG